MIIFLAILGIFASAMAQPVGQAVTPVYPEILDGACVSVKTNGVLFQCLPFDRPLNPARRGERDGRRMFILSLPKSMHAITGEFLKIKAIPRNDTYEVDSQTVELWQYVQ